MAASAAWTNYAFGGGEKEISESGNVITLGSQKLFFDSWKQGNPGKSDSQKLIAVVDSGGVQGWLIVLHDCNKPCKFYQKKPFCE